MHSLDIGGTIHSIVESASEHRPAIFLGLGLALVISSPILAVIATKKTLPEIEEKKNENAREQGYKCNVCGDYIPEDELYDHMEDENCGTDSIAEHYRKPLSVRDLFLVSWKHYILAVLSLVGGVTFICLSNKELSDTSLMYAAAYRLSEQTAHEYRDHVRAVVDDKKLEKIEHDISKDRMKNSTATPANAINTGHGNMLFYDAECGRYFRSDAVFIERMVNEFNKDFMTDIQKVNDGIESVAAKSITDLYDLMDLESGDSVLTRGWVVDSNTDREDYTIKLLMTYGPHPDTGEPCGIMRFKIPPHYSPYFYNNYY